MQQIMLQKNNLQKIMHQSCQNFMNPYILTQALMHYFLQIILLQHDLLHLFHLLLQRYANHCMSTTETPTPPRVRQTDVHSTNKQPRCQVVASVPVVGSREDYCQAEATGQSSEGSICIDTLLGCLWEKESKAHMDENPDNSSAPSDQSTSEQLSGFSSICAFDSFSQRQPSRVSMQILPSED